MIITEAEAFCNVLFHAHSLADKVSHDVYVGMDDDGRYKVGEVPIDNTPIATINKLGKITWDFLRGDS